MIKITAIKGRKATRASVELPSPGGGAAISNGSINESMKNILKYRI